MCKLLVAGILDNTLNLRASITTQRDRDAYAQLRAIGKLADGWGEEYFRACDAEIMLDYRAAILNDLKVEKVAPILPQVVAQMILLDPGSLSYKMIAEVLVDYPEWVMNVIGLNDGKSYLYFSGDGVKERLERLFSTEAENNHLLILDHFLLRKQIMKRAREKE